MAFSALFAEPRFLLAWRVGESSFKQTLIRRAAPGHATPVLQNVLQEGKVSQTKTTLHLFGVKNDDQPGGRIKTTQEPQTAGTAVCLTNRYLPVLYWTIINDEIKKDISFFTLGCHFISEALLCLSHLSTRVAVIRPFFIFPISPNSQKLVMRHKLRSCG